eukprot:jgi/Ulvmu1/7132/UM034_0038.1
MAGLNFRENTGGPMDWFNALPKLSKMFAASLVFTGACISSRIGIISYLLLDWSAVFSQLQVWRIFTHVFISGKLSLPLLIHVIWVLTYGATLESSTYSIHPEDYLFLYFFATLCLSAISLIVGPVLGIGYVTYTGSSVVMMLVYIWSKEFPHQDISLYGIIKIKGFWLPFALMGIGLFLGGDLMGDACGILVGHAWYFYTTLLPRGTGRQYLRTPWFIHWAAQKLELGPSRPAVSVTAPQGQRPQEAPAAAPGSGGFQAFRGSARRLGSS